jgi:hypothetical protein
MKEKELREAIAFLLELWEQEPHGEQGREATAAYLHSIEADVWFNPEHWTHAAAGAAVILESIGEEHPARAVVEAAAKTEWMIEIKLPEEESRRRLREAIKKVGEP